MMPRSASFAMLCTIVAIAAGCAGPWHHLPDGRHRSDLIDVVFKRRHYDPHAHAEHDPVMALASSLTMIEDDLRRDGTITVKKPDVWGDGNLIYFLQEFDTLLAERTTKFTETLQAYIARSDQAELQSTTALAAALGDDGPARTVPASGTANSNSNSTVVANSSASSATPEIPPLPTPGPINLPDYPLFDLIGRSRAAAPPAVSGIGVEPTELARQHSTFIDVCQALRRRHMGDDNSRAAGYGLYKFRIPVSVLPGRETNHGHSAVVTLRAQLVVDEANLRYTFPKLVIADLVDRLSPIILRDWDAKDDPKTVALMEMDAAIEILRALARHTSMSACPKLKTALGNLAAAHAQFRIDVNSGKSPDLGLTFDASLKSVAAEIEACQQESPCIACELGRFIQALAKLKPAPAPPDPAIAGARTIGTPADLSYKDSIKVYGNLAVRALRLAAKDNIKYEPGVPSQPAMQELREFLFHYLGQVHSVLVRNNAFVDAAITIQQAGDAAARGQFDAVLQARGLWMGQIACHELDQSLEDVSWLVAIQAGILNENLHRMLEELRLRGKLSVEDATLVRSPEIQFFSIPGNPGEPLPPQTVHLWEVIVREGFPLSVFTIDPQVEEQNVYDAFSRRREMQLALAYSVARGRFNTQQKLAFSRQLALDQAAIGLNRTVVGFSHGDDTFGWYFYPRVQSPPTESTNIGALARTIWSTGPTEHYDKKHRELEPGIRECEVLVAMPSFVTEVSFDVTTNWESLVHPGVTKRSYEEMLAQGSRIHHLKMCLAGPGHADCYRPGDVERLFSRVDQLEKMLGLQTYVVNVPYEYEQSGTDLFDTGDVQLRPVLTGFYGLEHLQPEATGFLFLTGKNFHPTLSHVIIGGVESHSLADPNTKPDVEVISRQLLRVKVSGLNKNLSRKEGFQVRVGTPAGLSNPLTITPQAPPPAPKGWSFTALAPKPLATLNDPCCTPKNKFKFTSQPAEFVISSDVDEPLRPNLNGRLVVQLTAKKKDGSAITFGGLPSPAAVGDVALHNPAPRRWIVTSDDLETLLDATLQATPPDLRKEEFSLFVTGYLAFDSYPLTKTLNALEITVVPCECVVGAPNRALPEALPPPPPPPADPHVEEKNPTAPAPEEAAPQLGNPAHPLSTTDIFSDLLLPRR